MSHDSIANNAEISLIQKARNKPFKNEVKIKFNNHKSQNVNFFYGESSLPHFPLPERENYQNAKNVDDFPKKQINFFNDLNDIYSNENDFNSYLFKNK